MKVEVDVDELAELRREKARLERKVTELQVHASTLVQAARDERIERLQQEWVTQTLAQAGSGRFHHGWPSDVRKFFEVAEQHVPAPFTPQVPEDSVVRFRARLIVEEVLETIKALFDCSEPPVPEAKYAYRMAKAALADIVEYAPVRVDLSEAIDGVVDSVYVLLGLPISFGVDVVPVWEGVQIANLSKQGGPVRASDGKRLKPEGWKPYDVARALVVQGWEPPEEVALRLLGDTFEKIGEAAKSCGDVLDKANAHLAGLNVADTEPPAPCPDGEDCPDARRYGHVHPKPGSVA